MLLVARPREQYRRPQLGRLDRAGKARASRSTPIFSPHPHTTLPAMSSDSPRSPRLASSKARVASFHAFGSAFKSDIAPLLPTGIYTIPEASMVGATEDTLRKDGVDVIVGRARYADLPRGQIIGDQTGFLKLVFRRDDMRLMGVHVIGEQATELVHVGMVAMLANADADLFIAPASITRRSVISTNMQPMTRSPGATS